MPKFSFVDPETSKSDTIFCQFRLQALTSKLRCDTYFVCQAILCTKLSQARIAQAPSIKTLWLEIARLVTIRMWDRHGRRGDRKKREEGQGHEVAKIERLAKKKKPLAQLLGLMMTPGKGSANPVSFGLYGRRKGALDRLLIKGIAIRRSCMFP